MRLPSALAGILTVGLTYALVKLLFKRSDLALLTAFLLAVSPWHIHFSRIAFEANVGVLLNIAMVYLFIRGLTNPKLLTISAFVAGLSIYAYQSEKVFTPLLVLALIIIYLKEIRQIPIKKILVAGLSGMVVILPMLFYLVTNESALTRARETSIFADKSNLSKNALRLDADTKSNDIPGLFFDNRRIFYFTKIIDGYIAHFSLNWLFITGDNNPRHHAPFMSLLYIVELPFLLIGVYGFLFYPFDKRAKWLVFLWFLLAPIPASITSGVPHAVRTINFLPLFQLFTAVGMLTSLLFLKKHTKKYVTLSLIGVGFFLFIFNFMYYFNQYFVQMNYFTSKDWQYGYAEVVPFVDSVSEKYDRIVVSNKEPLDQSYIFFLYYLKYDSKRYQMESAKNTSGGFAEQHAFGKYEFRPISWGEEEKDAKTLYIGRPSDFPGDIKSIKIKKYLNGEEAIIVVKGYK